MTQDITELLDAYRDRVPEYAKDPILFGLRGSHAHGTYRPPTDPTSVDDVDVFAVYAHIPSWYLSYAGYGRTQEDVETAGEHLDICAYDVRKFLSLLAKGNPNVHQWLWTPGSIWTAGGSYIVEARDRLTSKRMFPALIGYATAQMKKMLQGHTQGYMGAKRKVLLQQFGYDIKDASHCIRLLYQGIDLALHGILQVELSGQALADVLAIKTGQWSLRRVEALAEDLFGRFRAAEPLSTLRDEPDRELLDELFLDAINFDGDTHA